MINIKRLFVLTIFCVFFCVSQNYSQKINQLDTNGKRTGVWQKDYPNGKPRYTGEFLNGEEVGTFKFYRNAKRAVPHIIKVYTPNSNIAEIQFFNPLGQLKTEGKMVGKNREGVWKYYFTNGKIFSEEFYKEGKLEGVLKNYYSNGKLTEESIYKNNLKNGLSKIYTESGVLIEEEMYVDGKLNGETKYYDLKGIIKEKGVYKNGVKVGKWEFYIDGEVSDKPKRKTHLVPNNN